MPIWSLSSNSLRTSVRLRVRVDRGRRDHFNMAERHVQQSFFSLLKIAMRQKVYGVLC